nr:MAG TPA: Surface antigen [Herelleviridae sp.]
MHRKRYPEIRVDFITDDNIFTLRYNDMKQVTGEQIGNKILAFQTKNSMSDDSAIFSITVAGDTFWDKLLMVNDIIKIYVNPNPADDNEGLVLVGMVSQVTKLGAYANNQTSYKIVGQSFSKPFMKFGLGVIQEVQAVLPSTGWLVDGDRIAFTGKTASQIMEGVLNTFIPYMKYKYDDGTGNHNKTISDHFVWDDLQSWDSFENLKDPTQLTNFDGSFKQMMDLITAKPFNELFFRNDDKSNRTRLVMRKTPFNETEWKSLDYETVTSQDFVEENIGKNDAETYSIFTVTTPQMFKDIKADVFSKPQYHKELVDRYGYTKLEVENMYAPIESGTTSTEDSDNETRDAGDEQESYDKVIGDLKKEGQRKVSKDKNGWTSKLASKYKGLTKGEAKKLVDEFVKNGKVSKDKYKKIVQDGDSGEQLGTYNKIVNDLNNQGQELVLQGQDDWATKLSGKYKELTKDQATKIVKEFADKGDVSQAKYQEITGRNPENEGQQDNRPVATVASLKDTLKGIYKTNKDFDGEKGKQNKKEAIKQLSEKYRFGSKQQATRLVDEYIKYKGEIPNDDPYKRYINALSEISNVASDTGADATDNPMLIFSKMLYNWYYNNPNFFSGDIMVLGHHKYDIGKRLFVEDKQRNDVYEFYIESVEHNFNYTQGYYTTIGVTRGLKEAVIPEGSPQRFAPPWGQSSDFVGGLLGEKTLSDMKKEAVAEKEKNKGGSSGDSDFEGGGGSLKALEKYKGKLPKHNPGFVQPGNYHYKYQCTWYAYNRRAELGVPIPKQLWGDAAEWISASRSVGYKTGKTPKRGACAIWQRGVKGGSAQYGHVAIVEDVAKDGKSFKLSEHNYTIPNGYGERVISMSSPEGKNVEFIYDKG